MCWGLTGVRIVLGQDCWASSVFSNTISPRKAGNERGSNRDSDYWWTTPVEAFVHWPRFRWVPTTCHHVRSNKQDSTFPACGMCVLLPMIPLLRHVLVPPLSLSLFFHHPALPASTQGLGTAFPWCCLFCTADYPSGLFLIGCTLCLPFWDIFLVYPFLPIVTKPPHFRHFLSSSLCGLYMMTSYIWRWMSDMLGREAEDLFLTLWMPGGRGVCSTGYKTWMKRSRLKDDEDWKNRIKLD